MAVIVVGAGIAGLTAALHLHEHGREVVVLAQGAGSTPLAQGGVAGWYGAGDSPAAHAADTLTAGAGLSDPAAVDVLVGEGAARIAELVARGVAFDRAPDGTLALGREAAHAFPRIVHAGGDATGAEISRGLLAAVHAAGIPVVDGFLVDLLRGARAAGEDAGDAAVDGVRVLRDGGVEDLPADAVILATGGAGQLYPFTTNPATVTGDGIAAALRAGAAVADLEFVQFHPTMLAVGPSFLVSEAVRGEGAVLRDAGGRRFAFDAHPDGELAPRDVVARAIARQAAAQGAPVTLDATALGAETLARRFPTIDRVTRERGLDWARTPIPVTPAAHYLMGGIVTDLDGRATLPGLYACGETARTGVHGANRLASNSLLEGAVFGARAAAAAVTDLAKGRRAGAHPPAPLRGAQRPVPVSGEVPVPRPESPAAPFSRAALQQLMWERAGLLRTPEGLAAAAARLAAWADEVRDTIPRTVAEHEDRNLLLVAQATVRAARARRTSVGAHHLDAVPALAALLAPTA